MDNKKGVISATYSNFEVIRKSDLLWKMRCIIVWGFYIMGWVAAGGYFLYIFYLAFIHYGPNQFAAHFPPPADGFLFVGMPIIIYVVLAGLGRLFSWTDFCKRLPRFRDFGRSYRDYDDDW